MVLLSNVEMNVCSTASTIPDLLQVLQKVCCHKHFLSLPMVMATSLFLDRNILQLFCKYCTYLSISTGNSRFKVAKI